MPSKSWSRVVLSVKTLRPEVKDYWLPIPAEVLTIDGLIRHILTKESIDRDIDDVELYLFADLLRGDTSIAEILRHRDRIELRLKSTAAADGHKQRNNPLANTSSHKKRKTLLTIAERDHSEDSPDSAVGHTGDDSKRTADRRPTKRSKKSKVAANRSKELVNDLEPIHSDHAVVTSSGLVDSRRQSSVDNNCSGDESPTTAAAVEVVMKAEKQKPKIKRKQKPRKVETNEPAIETKTEPIATDKEKGDDGVSGTVASSDGAIGDDNRPKSGQKLRCERDGCDYKTRSAADFADHQSGHNSAAAVTDSLLKCEINGCGKGFKQRKGLSEHRLRVHPNDCPDVPWIHCSHTDCAFRSKSNGTISKHLKVHKKT